MMVAEVSVRDLMDKMNQGHALLILDVRDGFCESDQMIPGAIHVDAKHLTPDLFKLPKEAEIVVYDNESQNETAILVAEALVNAGFKANALVGGWAQWKKAGYPRAPREEVLLRHSKKAVQELTEAPAEAVKQPTRIERGKDVLKETKQELGKMAGEYAESAHEARTGVMDLAQKAVKLVVSLLRK